MSNFKKYSDNTLLSMTKKELIEQLRVAEYNREVAEQSLDLQAKLLKDWQPARYGKWVPVQRHSGGFRRETGLTDASETVTVTCDERIKYTDLKCSECGAFASDTFLNYCPKCGAKMDLEE